MGAAVFVLLAGARLMLILATGFGAARLRHRPRPSGARPRLRVGARVERARGVAVRHRSILARGVCGAPTRRPVAAIHRGLARRGAARLRQRAHARVQGARVRRRIGARESRSAHVKAVLPRLLAHAGLVLTRLGGVVAGPGGRWRRPHAGRSANRLRQLAGPSDALIRPVARVRACTGGVARRQLSIRAIEEVLFARARRRAAVQGLRARALALGLRLRALGVLGALARRLVAAVHQGLAPGGALSHGAQRVGVVVVHTHTTAGPAVTPVFGFTHVHSIPA